MGRVRPTHIKRAAEKLMDSYSDRFSDNFEENKKNLENLINTDSKKVKNRVAGYITSTLSSKERS